MQIIPGIHHLDSIKEVNVYLIIDKNKLILVDTGLPGQAAKILRYITNLGYAPHSIQYIVITHADLDHMGCVKKLKEACGAQIVIHRDDSSILRGEHPFKTIDNFLSPLVKLYLDLWHFEPVLPDILVDQDSQIGSWKIIHTPGHTAGSLCFYKPGQIVFVGDALRTNRKAKPRPISRRICVDLKEVHRSLIKLCALEYAVLLPGHGAPILQDASQILNKMMQRYPKPYFDRKKILGLY